MGSLSEDAEEYFRVWKPEQADPKHVENAEEVKVP
jgi:hypothetical protein